MLLSIGLGHCSSDGTLLFKLMSINKGQLEGLSVHEKKEECSLDFVERVRESIWSFSLCIWLLGERDRPCFLLCEEADGLSSQ